MGFGKMNGFEFSEGHCPEGQIVIWTAKLILLLPFWPESFSLVRINPSKSVSPVTVR